MLTLFILSPHDSADIFIFFFCGKVVSRANVETLGGVSLFFQVVSSHFKPYEAHSSESLRRTNKMILFAVITACLDRTHSYLCIQAQQACNDISSEWTLRQAINKADELQTAAAIIPELLMDRILIVSANTQVTFYMTVEALPYTSSSCFFPTVCQNNMLESAGGWS